MRNKILAQPPERQWMARGLALVGAAGFFEGGALLIEGSALASRIPGVGPVLGVGLALGGIEFVSIGADLFLGIRDSIQSGN